jgi:hypothetical protein
MLVDTATGTGTAEPAGGPAVRVDELRQHRDHGVPARDRRPRPDFRATLRSGPSADGSGPEAQAPTGAMLAGWFRAEVASSGAAPKLPAVSSPRPVERLLIGACGDAAEARIHIGAGALAGTEIRLHVAPGGSAVEAQLLTRVDGSRQTLAVVMDEIVVRLRGKGVALRVKPGQARERDERGERQGRR